MQSNKLKKTNGGSAQPIQINVSRNVDVPLGVSEKRRSVQTHLSKQNPKAEEIPANSKTKTIENKHLRKRSLDGLKSLHTPVTNSVYHLINNMDGLNINSHIKMENLTPKSKTAVTHEVTKKLNFPYDKPVYTDLVSIELDDTISVPDYATSSRSRKSLRDKYMKSGRKKDPVPELKDFLSPVKKIEIKVPLYTRQDVLKPPKYDLTEKVHAIVTNHPSYL